MYEIRTVRNLYRDRKKKTNETEEPINRYKENISNQCRMDGLLNKQWSDS